MDWNTFYVIGGFAAIVLAPVAAATLIGLRTKKNRESGSHKTAAFRVNDPVPPRETHHLRPKPRDRRMR